jgi:hypothetical protein
MTLPGRAPELGFRVDGAEPLTRAAVPTMGFRLFIEEIRAADEPATPIHSVVLRCQMRIEPARRRYEDAERERLLDLFGTPERWGQTVRPMLWTQLSLSVPGFTGSTALDVPVACGSDIAVAANRYFSALEDGDLPLGFLFSGTIFYEGDEGRLQVAQIPWDCEASFRLPAAAWQAMMRAFYPQTRWIGVRTDVFDRIDRYRRQEGHPTWEHALERLLDDAEATATP